MLYGSSVLMIRFRASPLIEFQVQKYCSFFLRTFLAVNLQQKISIGDVKMFATDLYYVIRVIVVNNYTIE